MISQIVDDIRRLYKLVSGEDLVVFIDYSKIETSDNWKQKMSDGLNKSCLLIPFLSPSYFKSEYCRLEWDEFYGKLTKQRNLIHSILFQKYNNILNFRMTEKEVLEQAKEIEYLPLEKVLTNPDEKEKLLKRFCEKLYASLMELRPEEAEVSNVHIICERVDDELTDKLRSEITEKLLSERRAIPKMSPICVIYTGGTVGMVRSDPYDKSSTLITGDVKALVRHVRRLGELDFDIDFYSYKTPLDSSNIDSEDWIRMARIIEFLYEHYQGFVILHGTDTMAYTASALSFMFENLGKPVILTGAEKPISEPGSDAELNVIRAIQIATPEAPQGPPMVPEVCIFFGKKLLRGNRTKKLISLDFEGFDSPNCSPLGRAEDTIQIEQREVRRLVGDSRSREFAVSTTKMSEDVIFFEVYPDMKPELFVPIVTSENIKGIILKTYGTGNAPTTPQEFLDMVQKAVSSGTVIINLTQCPKGHVEVRLFETNARLFDLGVVNGGDMTSEAAYCKLKFLLANNRDAYGAISIESVKREMQVDQRGELRFSAYTLSYRDGVIAPIYNGAPDLLGNFVSQEIDHAFLRIQGLEPIEGTLQRVKLRLYFSRPSVGEKEAVDDVKYRIGTIDREFAIDPKTKAPEPITQNLNATIVVRRFAAPEKQASLQIVSEGLGKLKFKTMELTIYTERR